MEYFVSERFPDPSSDDPVSIQRFFIEIIQTLLMAVVLFMVINTATARIRVRSISMQPTLYEQDFVIVNRLAYKMGNPQRGDVVVFQPPVASEEPYIKRVIGLPGDTVSISGGKVYVNNSPLSEPYIMAPPNYNGVWNVPEGQLFVLGDNRNNSSDSHQWGMVQLSSVMGKAEVVYFPITHWKMLNPSPTTAAAATP